VIQALGDFVTVQLYTDIVPIDSIPHPERKNLAKANIQRELQLFEDVTNPNYVVLDADGKVLGKLGGKVPVADFVGFLKSSLDKFKGTSKVAQGG
jgi:thiol:disulfide interchange protein DsbD